MKTTVKPLTPKQQEVLAQYVLRGISQTQLASQFHISQPAISKIITRGKARLEARGITIRTPEYPNLRRPKKTPRPDPNTYWIN